MEYDITDLLLTFESYEEYNEDDDIYILIYKRDDNISICLEINGKDNTSTVTVTIRENEIVLTQCIYYFCQSIQVLNSEKKQLEIFDAPRGSSSTRTFLNLEGEMRVISFKQI